MFLDNNNGLATHSAGWWMLAKGVSHASYSQWGPPTLESRLMKIVETLRVEDPSVEIEISEKLKVDRLVYRQIDQ